MSRSSEAHEILRSKAGVLSYLGDISIFDSNGDMINWSRPLPAPPLNISERAYFKSFKFDSRSPSILTESVRSYLNGNLNSVIAHRLRGEDGVFLGVMTRRINPVNYEKFFASVALGTGAAISMFHADGTLLARYPRVDELIGQNFAKAPLLQQVRERRHPADAARTKPDRPDGQAGFCSPARPLLGRRGRDQHGYRRARRLARTNPVPGHRGNAGCGGDRADPVPDHQADHPAEPRGAATAGSGTGPARYRAQQHDPGPGDVRRLGAPRHLQPALHRNARPVDRHREAGLPFPRPDAASQGQRIVRRRRRCVLLPRHAKHRARAGRPQHHAVPGRTRLPGRQQAAGGRRLGRHHGRHHRAAQSRAGARPQLRLPEPDHRSHPVADHREGRARPALSAGQPRGGSPVRHFARPDHRQDGLRPLSESPPPSSSRPTRSERCNLPTACSRTSTSGKPRGWARATSPPSDSESAMRRVRRATSSTSSTTLPSAGLPTRRSRIWRITTR